MRTVRRLASRASLTTRPAACTDSCKPAVLGLGQPVPLLESTSDLLVDGNAALAHVRSAIAISWAISNGFTPRTTAFTGRAECGWRSTD